MPKLSESIQWLEASLKYEADENVQAAWANIKPILNAAVAYLDVKKRDQPIALDVVVTAINRSNRERKPKGE